jgi:TPP-dependent 2-oxoacid decarboxylase
MNQPVAKRARLSFVKFRCKRGEWLSCKKVLMNQEAVMKMRLAHYLFRRLEECGASHTFGIPGDFALPLYAEQDEYGMRTIVCVHEPGCVYAADAYSRLRGLGVVLTTYGVGGLNMVNPVAMAYAEHSPVMIISGAPEITGRKDKTAFHHLVKDYGSQQRVYEEVTCATAALTKAETAAAEIDRVLDACLTYKLPGYIEIPRDMTALEIHVPETPSKCYTGPGVDFPALQEAVAEITGALEKAESPVLYTGVEIRRYGLVKAAIEFAENWQLPVISSVMGKASFPETHNNYCGVYMGDMGKAAPRECIEKADLVLAAGVIFSDVNTGFWTADIKRNCLIEMTDLDVKVSRHTYPGVPLASLLPALAETRPAQKKSWWSSVSGSREMRSATGNVLELRDAEKKDKLATGQLIAMLRKLEQKQFSFLADVGDAWFVGLELDADVFMAPGYYASMGFAVPGAVGAAIASPHLRPFVLVGDGAFQMTGNELSTLVANKLGAIVIILNNRYYKMLAALDGHREYYNLHNWDYVKYAESLGCWGIRAENEQELGHALEQALALDLPCVIEVVLDKEDHAPIMRRIKEYFAKK